MLHQLNRRVQVGVLGLGQDLGEILQDQTASGLGPLAAELGEIVADAATDVDEEGVVLAGLGVVDQTRDVVEADVHPAGTALAVDGHVVVELLGGFGVVLDELEEVLLGVEAELEAAVEAVGGVAVAVFLQLGGEGEDSFGDACGPKMDHG